MPHNKLNLGQTTKKVFNDCASVYLKEDKHWGCDLDIISEYVEKFSNSNVIEVGTGHAWHLANLFFKSPNNLGNVIGIDYSDEMLNRSRTFLKSIKYNGKTLNERIELYNENILALSYKKPIFDVALLLNNTLGNIAGKDFIESRDNQKICLRNLRKILRPTGVIIVSVYNSSKLTEEDKYGDVFELDHKLSNLDTSDLVVRFKATDTPYYSHWFTKDEICKLLYEVSFRIVEVEERKKRIIVVAQKKKI